MLLMLPKKFTLQRNIFKISNALKWLSRNRLRWQAIENCQQRAARLNLLKQYTHFRDNLLIPQLR